MSHIPYASVCVSLMYAIVTIRPDIVHVVGMLSRFISNPGKAH